MSRKSKKQAWIWNNYICPSIEIAVCSIIGVLTFVFFCIAPIIIFG